MYNKKIQGINPMGLCDSWDEYKNKQFFTNIKIKQTALRCNTKYLQAINPISLCDPLVNTY